MQLGDYIDGELEAELCAQLEQHLANCDNCRIMVDTTHKTVLLYRRQSQKQPVHLSAKVNDRLWQALESEGCISKSED
jgi:predicted anti-sigma-YlaC factor YlaD